MKRIIMQLIRTYKMWMRLPAIIMIAASCAYGTLYKDDEPDIPDLPLPEPPKMTLALNKSGEVSIEVFGTGDITIDWGDGKEKEKHTISNNTSFSNVYSNANSRTITIAGANIMRLNCSGNKITQLNVSEITTLGHLFCSSNELENLDLSKNKNLLTIFCDDNKIKSLNVSANTALKTLYCNNNRITSLDMSKNTVLQTLKCSFNEMNAAALSELLLTLHGNPVQGDKTVIINNNPGANMYKNKDIAVNNGWEVIDGEGWVEEVIPATLPHALGDYTWIQNNPNSQRGWEIDASVKARFADGSIKYFVFLTASSIQDRGGLNGISIIFNFNAPSPMQTWQMHDAAFPWGSWINYSDLLELDDIARIDDDGTVYLVYDVTSLPVYSTFKEAMGAENAWLQFIVQCWEALNELDFVNAYFLAEGDLAGFLPEKKETAIAAPPAAATTQTWEIGEQIWSDYIEYDGDGKEAKGTIYDFIDARPDFTTGDYRKPPDVIKGQP